MKTRTIILAILAVTFIIATSYLILKRDALFKNRQGISFEEDMLLSPSYPTNLNVKSINSGILLTWLGTGDDRIAYYQIYIKDNNGKWEKFSRVNSTEDNSGTYESLIPISKAPSDATYAVSAINKYGKESQLTQSN